MLSLRRGNDLESRRCYSALIMDVPCATCCIDATAYLRGTAVKGSRRVATDSLDDQVDVGHATPEHCLGRGM